MPRACGYQKVREQQSRRAHRAFRIRNQMHRNRASAQCSYCAVKLDTPRLQSAGEQQRGIFDKKRFIILDIHIGRQLSEFLGIIQNNYLFCIICASPIFALRRSRRSACETDLRVSSSIFLSERSIVLTHTNQLSEISRSVFAFVSCITA